MIDGDVGDAYILDHMREEIKTNAGDRTFANNSWRKCMIDTGKEASPFVGQF
jgi:hypothetical protein